MKDLGETYDSEPAVLAPPKSKEKKKTYPKLCLRDKSLEAVFGKDLPRVGSDLEGEIMLKVSGISDDEYSRRVEFDVVSLELDGNDAAEDAAEGDAEEA